MFGIDNFIDGRSLQSLGNSVRQMFESISVQAQAKWFKQHDRDGAHSALTAISIVAPSVSAGRLRVGSPDGTLYALLPNTSAHVNNWVPTSAVEGQVWGPHVSVLYVVSQSNTWALAGLDATGRESGDIVFLVAAQDLDVPSPGVTTSLFLNLNAGTSLLSNQFRYARGSSGAGVEGCVAGHAMMLMYFKLRDERADSGTPGAPVRIGPSMDLMSGWYLVKAF